MSRSTRSSRGPRKKDPPSPYDRHNTLALLDTSGKGAVYADVIRYLHQSPIKYAITANPVLRADHIGEFWNCAVVDEEDGIPRAIRVEVAKNPFTVTEESIGRVLKIEPDSPDADDILPDLVIKGGVRKLGYNGLLDPAEYKKADFPRKVRFFIHTLIQCLIPWKSGYDVLERRGQSLLVGLAFRRPFNIAKYLFNNMVWNIRHKKDTFDMYPRFVQLLIDDVNPNIPHYGKIMTRVVFDKRVFTTCGTRDADLVGALADPEYETPPENAFDDLVQPDPVPSSESEASKKSMKKSKQHIKKSKKPVKKSTKLKYQLVDVSTDAEDVDSDEDEDEEDFVDFEGNDDSDDNEVRRTDKQQRAELQGLAQLKKYMNPREYAAKVAQIEADAAARAATVIGPNLLRGVKGKQVMAESSSSMGERPRRTRAKGTVIASSPPRRDSSPPSPRPGARTTKEASGSIIQPPPQQPSLPPPSSSQSKRKSESTTISPPQVPKKQRTVFKKPTSTTILATPPTTPTTTLAARPPVPPFRGTTSRGLGSTSGSVVQESSILARLDKLEKNSEAKDRKIGKLKGIVKKLKSKLTKSVEKFNDLKNDVELFRSILAGSDKYKAAIAARAEREAEAKAQSGEKLASLVGYSDDEESEEDIVNEADEEEENDEEEKDEEEEDEDDEESLSSVLNSLNNLVKL